MLCVCWLAYCGAPRTNTLPLKFGMTPSQAELALGQPLVFYSGRGGSQIYVTTGPAGIPGFYRVDTLTALQFRGGRLTGWKMDYRMRDEPQF